MPRKFLHFYLRKNCYFKKIPIMRKSIISKANQCFLH